MESHKSHVPNHQPNNDLIMIELKYPCYDLLFMIYDVHHMSMIHDLQKCFKNWLVVSTSQSVGSILPNICKNKIHVPNHQPDNVLIMIKISVLSSMIYDIYIYTYIHIYHIYIYISYIYIIYL